MSERCNQTRGPVRAGLLATLCAALLACTEPSPLRESLLVFGTEAQIELRSADMVAARAALTRSAAELNRLHRDWHPWEPGALTHFNDALAGGAAVAIPEVLQLPLARGRELAVASDGLFNPAIGRLVDLWGFHTHDYPVHTPPPAADVLLAWREDVPTLAQLELLDDGRVRSLHPQLQLDFTAMAEGFAASLVAEHLLQAGVAHAMIAIGGDVLVLGDAGRRPWQVGVRDPFDEGALLAGIALHDGEALFSSGSYARYRESPLGGRWPHVIDARSGLPARGVAAVSVLHRDPVLADAAATALMVAGPTRLAEVAERLGVRCVLLLTEDDTLLATTAMHARLRLLREPTRRAPPLPPDGDCHRAD
jgi:FAD:protein FMN transferase